MPDREIISKFPREGIVFKATYPSLYRAGYCVKICMVSDTHVHYQYSTLGSENEDISDASWSRTVRSTFAEWAAWGVYTHAKRWEIIYKPQPDWEV